MSHHPLFFASGFMGYLFLLVGLGAFVSKKMRNLQDFFLANQALPGLAIAITFVAAWFGAGSTIGTMNEAYKQGLSAIWLIAIPSVLSCLLIGLVFAKRVRQLDMLSQPQAVERQYGPLGSAFLASIILLSITTFIASQLVAAANVLQAAMGLSPTAGVACMMLAIITYSVLGGFRAVVMTDVLQFILFSLALIILLGFTVISPSYLNGQLTIPPMFWNPWYDLPKHLAMAFTFILAWSIAPEMWQRMTSTQNPQAAQRAALYAGGALLVLYTLVITIGIQAVQVLPGLHDKSQPVLLALANALPSPWLTLLVLVGVLSAITSTIDSSLNVGSLTLTRDIVYRYVFPNATPGKLVWLSRFGTTIIGLPACLIALYYQDIIQILWISADIYASAMFIPMMGLFFAPQAGRLSGVLAMGFGICPVLVNFANDFHWITLPPTWPAWPYTTLLGVAISALGFLIGLFWDTKRTSLACRNEVTS